MSLRQLDLTTALRPSLLPDEVLLFVQDGIGLYEGKFKLPFNQNGQAYLTSHRLCYVDNAEPRVYSVALDLRDVERHEFYAGFLKSSPKVTLFLKTSQTGFASSRASPVPNLPLRNGPPSSLKQGDDLRLPSPAPAPAGSSQATWICSICSYPNLVPSNFDPATANEGTPLPPCLTCGIKPQLAHVLKAAISAASSRTSKVNTSDNGPEDVSQASKTKQSGELPPDGPALQPNLTVQCERCTFLNHPSLHNCEICGALLSRPGAKDPLAAVASTTARSESPGPVLGAESSTTLHKIDNIKVSFRAGGEKTFYDRLKGALVQRKWLLQGAPPIPRPNSSVADAGSGRSSPATPVRNDTPSGARASNTVGIAGLEQRGAELRKNNELVIGGAFEDLEALMTSAKEIIELAESFARRLPSTAGGDNSSSPEATALLSQSAAALGLVTTKDMLNSGSASESLYLSELSRNLAEFLTDDSRGVLRHEGGIMSLVDLWAVFNRARGGAELVSPSDFQKAASLWQQLKMPLRLRKFRSGLMVVQSKDWTDERTIASLLSWLKDLHEVPPEIDDELTEAQVTWDWRLYGRGITAQQTAERFGWSVGVASEELEMAEENGALCREESVEGIRFWENWLVKQI